MMKMIALLLRGRGVEQWHDVTESSRRLTGREEEDQEGMAGGRRRELGSGVIGIRTKGGPRKERKSG